MNEYPPEWPAIALAIKTAAGWQCVRCRACHDPARGYTLTVHHLDGDKSNCETWNLAALCQRCHLHIQNKVRDMDQELLPGFGHSAWMQPFVEGRRAARARAIEETGENHARN